MDKTYTTINPRDTVRGGNDLVAIAVPTFFQNDANPLSLSLLLRLVEREFQFAGIHTEKTAALWGLRFLVASFEVHDKRPALETLSMAGKGLAGVEVAWFDGAENVWRPYKSPGRVALESLISSENIAVFKILTSQRRRAIDQSISQAKRAMDGK